METDGDILSAAARLRPLLELVQQENFIEAEVLAEYFPKEPPEVSFAPGWRLRGADHSSSK